MKFTFIFRMVLILSGAVVSGCAGYDRAFLATKTNVGLDIDSKPPTAEITIARKEMAILPTFPGAFDNAQSEHNSTTTSGSVQSEKKETSGKESTLPVLASFGLEGGFFNPKITGHFAGGDAAVYLAGEDREVDSTLCLASEKKIDMRSPLLKFWHWITFTPETDALEQARAEVRPFYFATDTAFGVKVAWSGTTGPYPDALKLGYNRKEFASPPIFINKGCGSETKAITTITEGKAENATNGSAVEKWSVKLPSFYASTHNESDFGYFFNSRVKHLQFFATGQAAAVFAKKASVRRVAFENMVPEAAESEAENLNKELIADIEKAFAADKKEKADITRQDKILAKAVELELVPQGTTKDMFSDKLQNNATGINYSVSAKLNKLRTVSLDGK